MRNLSIASCAVHTVPLSSPNGERTNITASCVDLDEDALFVLSERTISTGQVNLIVWRFSAQSSEPNAFASFTIKERTLASRTTAQYQVVLFRIHAESRRLCIVLANGDIATILLDEAFPEVEIVGSFEPGIRAASWSPDEGFLILVNGDGQLIQMTRDFDILYESPLGTSDFGEDKQNALGWGSKSTQFHGSLGKSAATASEANVIGSSPDDDGLPRISWRGDAAFFCISSLESFQNGTSQNLPRRVIRVYSPSPSLTLHSTMEPTAGLEHPLSWNSTGSLVASSQRFGSDGLGAGRDGRHDIIFFERNGLRRGGFEIVKGGTSQQRSVPARAVSQKPYRIREVAWSCDSSILAVWLLTEIGDVVQLWSMGNYHWYLKQSIAHTQSSFSTTSMSWHPEDPLTLYLTAGELVSVFTFAWETCASPVDPPHDTGSVAVVDGASILMTPFRSQNVPPPMSSYQLSTSPTQPFAFPAAPTHISFSLDRDLLGVLHNDTFVDLWNLHTNVLSASERGKAKVAEPERIWRGNYGPNLSASMMARQIAIFHNPLPSAEGEWLVAVLESCILPNGTGRQSDRILFTTAKEATFTIDAPDYGYGRLLPTKSGLCFQSRKGDLYKVDIENQSMLLTNYSFPEFCFDAQSVVSSANNTGDVFIGLARSGKLFSNSSPISDNVTSYTLTPSYLVYTTSLHEAHFVPIASLSTASIVGPAEKRRVERGSRIVVAIPSTMSLVLQMPRGNLETISPRPFVIDLVRADIESKQYRKAFLACRKHRIDLNVLIDHDPEAFMKNLRLFAEEVNEVDHLNLFLAGVGRSSQTPTKIALICDALRRHLEEKDLNRYVNSILTAHVVKTPSDLEGALGLLSRLQDGHAEAVEDAVKYIIFLVDANTLFDAALGMYNFTLTLLIAQHSQRDPREYVPFLRGLRALPEAYQRFSIDDHLKHYSKALIGIRDAGEGHFDEAVAYIERHKLYEESLVVWKGVTEKRKRLLEVYGDYLFERREYERAALSFYSAECWRKSLLSYEKAHAWREAFALAPRAELNQEEMDALATRISEDLLGRKRFTEAGQVMLDYSHDLQNAVIAFVQGNEISEALRIASLHSRPDLVESAILPSVLVLREEIGDEIQEVVEQLSKQSSRLKELEAKKNLEPDSFYMSNNEALHDVEMMTDAGDSVVSTAFTRYTAAPSSSSRVSRQSSKSRKKAERKKGRKGTVDEEEYIVASIAKLVTRLDHLKTECSKILPHLSIMSPEHHDEGRTLQAELRDFEAQLLSVIDNVWPVAQAGDVSGEAAKEAKAIPPKPIIQPTKWEVAFLDDM